MSYRTSPLEIKGRFMFNIEGLNITYVYRRQTTHLQLCPKATCQLLKEAGLIEDFDIDSNGEPVILFSDYTMPPGYGFDRWNLFVCTFRLSHRMATKLMEYREDRLSSQDFQDQISHLLSPLQAA
ncbi:MAG TPA: hypothetical protein VGN63_19585 [Flavisolibacter sp.]|jgi:hypothetical protein|nr:hypothetical protein [Flavisolibacter sp.]